MTMSQLERTVEAALAVLVPEKKSKAHSGSKADRKQQNDDVIGKDDSQPAND